MADVVDRTEGAEAAHRVVDLNGEYRFKVDAKGRMSLPAKYRKALSEDLVVTINPHDECLFVFETDAFNDWIVQVFQDKFGGYVSTDRQHVGLRRKLKARAKDVEVDGSGRIMLSAEQRAAVDIDKDVVIVGNRGYFEIWDAKRYEQQSEDYDLGLLFD